MATEQVFWYDGHPFSVDETRAVAMELYFEANAGTPDIERIERWETVVHAEQRRHFIRLALTALNGLRKFKDGSND